MTPCLTAAAKLGVITLRLALIELLHIQSWGLSEAPGKIATVLTDAILTESSVVFINNRFSVCRKPLVDFLSAEIVVSDSSVKLYGV